MGGKVSGLLTQIKDIATGRLVRNNSASIAATMVCPGMGRKAQNRPMKKEAEMDIRLI